MRFDFNRWNIVDELVSPSKLAVVGSDRQLTWKEFNQESRRLVDLFVSNGAGPTRPVLIYGHKETSFVSAMVGCMLAGIPYIPVDTIIPKDRILQIIDATQPGIMFCCQDQGDWPVPVLMGLSGILNQRQSRDLASKLESRPNDPLVYIIFTSGSTGLPKGVQISREAVKDFSGWLQTDFGFQAGEVFFNQAPFSFDLSVFEFIGFLITGGTIVLTTSETQMDLARLQEHLERTKCSTWVSTPSFATIALRNQRFSGKNLPKLKTFLFCGEVLSKQTAGALLEKFPDAKVLNTYGPTEATVATTLVKLDSSHFLSETLPVGSVKPGSKISISPSQEDPSGIGEIIIEGKNVSIGYLNNSELNSEKFFEREGARGFRTGDWGYFKEGQLFFLGRKDNQIKLHGFRIELGDIDAKLESVGDLIDCAVTIPLRKNGEVKRLVSFIKLKVEIHQDLKSNCLAELKLRLSALLPHYMIPSEIVPLSEFPINSNHKIDRKKLLEIYTSGDLKGF